MYPRHITPQLEAALQDTPVILLNGARQTGKSTLAQTLLANPAYRYLTLDDTVVLATVFLAISAINVYFASGTGV